MNRELYINKNKKIVYVTQIYYFFKNGYYNRRRVFYNFCLSSL